VFHEARQQGALLRETSKPCRAWFKAHPFMLRPRRGGFAIRRILALICLSFVAVATAQAANAAARVALVIGNAGYQSHRLPKLAKSAADAAAMADLFRRAGFQVKEAKNLGFFAFKDAIREFAAQASDAEIAVIYFSGHGIGIDGINYLLPIDAKLTIDDDAPREGVDLDSVLSAVMPARHLGLVILDASRARPLVEVMRHTSRAVATDPGARPVEALPANVMVASAAKPGSTTKDGNGSNSPYTAALLKHLAQPGLDIAVAFARVHDEMVAGSKNAQEPVVYGSYGGEPIAIRSGNDLDSTPQQAR
jgi:uncharacterized caspase-like protein